MAGGVCRALLGRLPGAVVTGGAVAVVAWLLSGVWLMAAVAGAMALLFTLLGPGIGAYVAGRASGGRGGRADGDSGRMIFRGGGLGRLAEETAGCGGWSSDGAWWRSLAIWLRVDRTWSGIGRVRILHARDHLYYRSTGTRVEQHLPRAFCVRLSTGSIHGPL